jgi:hypothetical protein
VEINAHLKHSFFGLPYSPIALKFLLLSFELIVITSGRRLTLSGLPQLPLKYFVVVSHPFVGIGGGPQSLASLTKLLSEFHGVGSEVLVLDGSENLSLAIRVCCPNALDIVEMVDGDLLFTFGFIVEREAFAAQREKLVFQLLVLCPQLFAFENEAITVLFQSGESMRGTFYVILVGVVKMSDSDGHTRVSACGPAHKGF